MIDTTTVKAADFDPKDPPADIPDEEEVEDASLDLDEEDELDGDVAPRQRKNKRVRKATKKTIDDPASSYDAEKEHVKVTKQKKAESCKGDSKSVKIGKKDKAVAD